MMWSRPRAMLRIPFRRLYRPSIPQRTRQAVDMRGAQSRLVPMRCTPLAVGRPVGAHFAPNSAPVRVVTRIAPREDLMVRTSLYASVATIALAAFLAASPAPVQAQQATQVVEIDNDDIGGVVTGPKGPEAGVW